MVQSALSDILHVLSQGLLAPVIIVLLLLMAYALFCIGSVIAEYFTERKHFQVTMPKFLAALMAAKQDEIPQVIEESGLLNRQKSALLTVYDYRMLPGESLIALIKRLVGEEEARYDRAVNRNNVAARVAPMIGLMGTLIPLGPGIEALGRSEVETLSSSLLVAFDTTVAGLVVAAVCLIVGKIRSSWYENYLSALDAGMATMLEKIEAMRDAGEIKTEEPTDFAFMFNQRVAERSGKGGAAAQPSPEQRTAQPDAAKPEAAKQESPKAEAAQAEPLQKEAAAAAAAAPASSAATEAPKAEKPVADDGATSFFGNAAPSDPTFLNDLAANTPAEQAAAEPMSFDFEPRKDPLANGSGFSH